MKKGSPPLTFPIPSFPKPSKRHKDGYVKRGSLLQKAPSFHVTYSLVKESSVLSTSLMVAAALMGVQILLSSPLLMQSMKYLISPA